MMHFENQLNVSEGKLALVRASDKHLEVMHFPHWTDLPPMLELLLLIALSLAKSPTRISIASMSSLKRSFLAPRFN